MVNVPGIRTPCESLIVILPVNVPVALGVPLKLIVLSARTAVNPGGTPVGRPARTNGPVPVSIVIVLLKPDTPLVHSGTVNWYTVTPSEVAVVCRPTPLVARTVTK